MKFNHPKDTKAIIIGIATSIIAVALWDTYKWKGKLLQFKKDTSKVPLVLVYAVVGLVFYYYAKKNKWLEA